MFWMDNSEPDFNVYDYGNYRYQLGTAYSCSNIYPIYYSKTFYDGMRSIGKNNNVNLERCAWVGSQKYSNVIWNGDVQSTWECLRTSICEGLNIGIAGIPWWNTDIGGFMYGNPEDPKFVELLERWFEWAVFSPILRLHGDRDPHDTPPLDKDPQRGYGGGYLYTGRPNEIWSYGPEAQKIMEKQIKLRESLVPYIEKVMKEASEMVAQLCVQCSMNSQKIQNVGNLKISICLDQIILLLQFCMQVLLQEKYIYQKENGKTFIQKKCLMVERL